LGALVPGRRASEAECANAEIQQFDQFLQRRPKLAGKSPAEQGWWFRPAQMGL
jgi:hypothetical protein